MKRQNTLFLTLGLGVCSVTLLVDRFLVTISDWLVIVLMLIASASLIYHLIFLRKNK